MVLKDWEDIVEETVIAHFIEPFWTRQEGDKSDHFCYLLSEKNAYNSEGAQARLEELPTQDDLKWPVMCLRKLQSPRPNGVLVKYYLDLWESIGHLLHLIFVEGIWEDRFNLVFVRGVIVLLPKARDFKLLHNNCPITLFNSMFKIYSKHYQMLLAKVCMEFISPYQ